MCGIHFILDKNSLLDDGPIQAMISSTHYRGPDDQGFKIVDFKGSKYFFGANKLNITDGSTHSSQPFVKNGKDCILVFNGEIYNYQDLKNQQLQQKEIFHSSSDTEVLYNHLQQNGNAGIKDLNGMFAFIFFNVKKGILIVARDRWGMKPLYQFEDENYFILSSEIKGILASGLVKSSLNEIAVGQYLKYRYVRGDFTFYEGIQNFKPNSWQVYKDGEKEHEGPIHEFTTQSGVENAEIPEKEVIDKLDQLLGDALMTHLAPERNTGLFLSGGVDSTLLLAKLHELGVRQIPVYSFVSSKEDKKFGTQDYDYARMAAKQYQAEYNEVQTDSASLEKLDDFINKVDQPVGDSAALMTFILSSKSSSRSRVVFSGAGADELFAGYNRHQAFHFYLKNYYWLKYLKSSGKIYGRSFSLFDHSTGRLIQKFFSSIDRSPAATWDNMISTASSLDQNVAMDLKLSTDPMASALEDDRNNYLIKDVLEISDRMSMLASQEMRMPYLDNQLSGFITSLNSRYLINNGPKHLLKKLLKQKGGSSFAKRKKEGFGLPFGGWVNKKNIGLWEFVQDRNHIVFNFTEPSRIERLLIEHVSGSYDHSLSLWSVLILARWLEKNFN